MSNFKFTEAEENVIYSLSIDLDSREISFHKFIKGIEQIINERDGWISVHERLPEILETVWITNGKGWTTLGCRSDYHHGDGDELVWCWCATNGVIYEEDGKIVSECEEDDLDVCYWQPLPSPPKSKQ